MSFPASSSASCRIDRGSSSNNPLFAIDEEDPQEGWLKETATSESGKSEDAFRPVTEAQFTDVIGGYRQPFAAAHWNPTTSVLSAARDPFGIKQLYLLDHPSGGVSLCSEMAPLLSLSEGCDLDPIGIAQYLSFGHTLAQFTCRRNIRRLSPGVIYQWKISGKNRVSLSTRRIGAPPELESEPLNDALDFSIGSSLSPELPTSVVLDGSSASRLLFSRAWRENQSIKAISFQGYDHSEFEHAGHAELLARRFGTPLTVFTISSNEIIQSIDTLLRNFGEPIFQMANLPVTCLSLNAHFSPLTILTADGADTNLFTNLDRRSRRIPFRKENSQFAQFLSPLAEMTYHLRGSTNAGRILEAMLRLGGPRSFAALVNSSYPTFKKHGRFGQEIESLLFSDWEGVVNESSFGSTSHKLGLTRILPNLDIQNFKRSNLSLGIDLRTPFLHPRVINAEIHFYSKLGRRVRKHEHELASLMAPQTRDFPATSAWLSRELVTNLQNDQDRIISSKNSLLKEYFGQSTVEALFRRSARSKDLALRLAIFNRWEATIVK